MSSEKDCPHWIPSGEACDLCALLDAESACREALEAIAPCVVGWPEGQMPSWAQGLYSVVPHLQRVLGIGPTAIGPEGDGFS